MTDVLCPIVRILCYLCRPPAVSSAKAGYDLRHSHGSLQLQFIHMEQLVTCIHNRTATKRASADSNGIRGPEVLTWAGGPQ